MAFITSLVNSIKQNAELTVLILLLWSTSFVWGNNTFASDQDIDNAIEQAISPLTKTINLLGAQVKRNGDSIVQFQRASLQQERREVTREINQLRRVIESGEGTERDQSELDDLISDLDDINDALAAMPQI
jgi:hypothetical protein